ncbi:amidase signature domain-containing protein [Papiliotrema laurentii]|uniref:Amidase signature domain-containing protein n=1 Tax=Papiliotrema laurentii TaxID=5418 RepID=A0AAD9CW58_PAPLA|nr:amidase signature domain-containing protein [Papiliotrema laurentii]
MTLQIRTALLAATPLLLLIPTFNLRVTRLSTWLADSATSRLSAHQIQGLDAIAIDKTDELKYHVGNVTYFTPTHAPVQVFPFIHYANTLPKEQEGFFPLTVLRLPLDQVVLDYTTISSIIKEYLLIDDVLTPAWLETLVLVPNNTYQGKASTITLIDKETFARLGQDYNVKRVFVDPSFTLPRSIGLLVYRLYSDTYRTFLFGLYKPLPHGDDPQYQAFREVDERGYSLIPIASRLSTLHMNNGNGPFRIGVKDLYDIKGVPTSAGSRAYGEMYGPVNQTALSLRLLDPETAIFVGKTKTTAFAAKAFAHEFQLDEQQPFSPRGDGWQNCVGSSHGSACAVAAYDWLDLALGSDTAGSIRVPVTVIGYSRYHTSGQCCTYWEYADAAGVLARDPNIFAKFIRAWSSLSLSHRAPAATFLESPAYSPVRLPHSLLVATDYLMQTNPTAQQVVDKWVQAVQDTLGLAVEKIHLDSVLEDAGYAAESVERLRNTMGESANWWSWSKVGKQFLENYAERHNGQEPGLDPGIRSGWSMARKSGSWEKYQANANRFTEFQEWFANNIFKEQELTCGDQFLISSMGIGGWPTYGEHSLNQDVPPRRTRFEGRDLCTFAGCAEYMIPIGQVPYHSKVSNVVEQQAVTISLIANRHCDSELLRFIETLAQVRCLLPRWSRQRADDVKAGLIGPLKTGRTAF